MKEKKQLTAYWRLFKYIWPQKTRFFSVILLAVILSAMYSLNFAAALPLLKVMMNEEGLHNWIDRKVCKSRYDMDFYVPDKIDYQAADGNALYTLEINSIDDGSEGDNWAFQAGFRRHDKILGVGSDWPTETVRVRADKMLENMATFTDTEPVSFYYSRLDQNGNTQFHEISLIIPAKPWFSDIIQWPVSFISRENTKETKKKALYLVFLGVGVITVIRCFARFYQNYLSQKVIWVAISNVREDLFAHTMHMPVGFFASEGTSDTTSRIQNDIARCSIGIKVLLNKAIREPLKAIFTLAAAMFISWKLTLVFLGMAPAVGLLLGLLGKKIKMATKRSLATNAEMLGRLQGAMGALRVVKVYNQQGHEIQKYHETNRTLLRRLLKVAMIESIANPLMEILGMIALLGALFFGLRFVMEQSQGLNNSSFIMLLVFLGATAESIRKAADLFNQLQQSNAAAERVFEIMDEPAEKETDNAIELAPVTESIEFEDIVFTYPGASCAALNGVNLKVDSGQTIAVVGSNGSGKSTLVNLLPRFYDPDSGVIRIDGQDIHQATLSSLRGQIGMVTQSVVTFNDTIANNIAYGCPDASMETIIAAAKKAFAHEFIEPLPRGYDTMIGEHSSGFSGGQLQRMVIARAILKDPQILIFDEAMSQIDADSEAKIHNALSELMKGRTCFLIAHRFSTVISADTIVVVDQGQIIAQGTHDELIQSCQTYKRLYETQLLA